MNLLEVDAGITVNLEHVKAIMRLDDNSTSFYFGFSDQSEVVVSNLPYDTVRSLLKLRSSREESASSEQTSVLKRILQGQATPVP